MCSNTFVSELKETFTSTHTYLMNTLLSMSVVGASKSCGNNSGKHVKMYYENTVDKTLMSWRLLVKAFRQM